MLYQSIYHALFDFIAAMDTDERKLFEKPSRKESVKMTDSFKNAKKSDLSDKMHLVLYSFIAKQARIDDRNDEAFEAYCQKQGYEAATVRDKLYYLKKLLLANLEEYLKLLHWKREEGIFARILMAETLAERGLPDLAAPYYQEVSDTFHNLDYKALSWSTFLRMAEMSGSITKHRSVVTKRLDKLVAKIEDDTKMRNRLSSLVEGLARMRNLSQETMQTAYLKVLVSPDLHFLIDEKPKGQSFEHFFQKALFQKFYLDKMLARVQALEHSEESNSFLMNLYVSQLLMHASEIQDVEGMERLLGALGRQQRKSHSPFLESLITAYFHLNSVDSAVPTKELQEVFNKTHSEGEGLGKIYTQYYDFLKDAYLKIELGAFLHLLKENGAIWKNHQDSSKQTVVMQRYAAICEEMSTYLEKARKTRPELKRTYIEISLLSFIMDLHLQLIEDFMEGERRLAKIKREAKESDLSEAERDLIFEYCKELGKAMRAGRGNSTQLKERTEELRLFPLLRVYIALHNKVD